MDCQTPTFLVGPGCLPLGDHLARLGHGCLDEATVVCSCRGLILGQVILWHTTEYLGVSFNNSAEESIPEALNLGELLDINGKADVAVLCILPFNR